MRATLQVGDGDVIAERLGGPGRDRLPRPRYRGRWRRRADLAAGRPDPVRSRDGPARRAVLNLGGIANITVLDHDPCAGLRIRYRPGELASGPAGSQAVTGELDCDRDGQIASSGKVNEGLVETLLKTDPYLARRPPKSTGFEMYGDAFIDRAAALHGGV